MLDMKKKILQKPLDVVAGDYVSLQHPHVKTGTVVDRLDLEDVTVLKIFCSQQAKYYSVSLDNVVQKVKLEKLLPSPAYGKPIIATKKILESYDKNIKNVKDKKAPRKKRSRRKKS